jgi:hypothetical protein
MWVFPYHGAHTLADHNGSRGSSELYQHGPNKRPSKSAQRRTSFKDAPYLCPTRLYYREFRLSSETAQYNALNQLTRRLNRTCRLCSGCSIVYTNRGKRYIHFLRNILRSSFLPNYLLSQPAIAAESGSEEGFLPEFN